MTIIAIDPGLDGAAAILHDGGELIEEFDLPTTGESEGAQRRLDAANLAYLIGGHGPMLSPSSSRPARALDGSLVNVPVRAGARDVLGVIGALAIPIRQMPPAKWKKALGLDSDGETSLARAIETWPVQAELFARKRDHSRGEAALLGLYALKADRQSADARTIDQMHTETVLKAQSA